MGFPANRKRPYSLSEKRGYLIDGRSAPRNSFGKSSAFESCQSDPIFSDTNSRSVALAGELMKEYLQTLG
jgi:hypothetical protein